jgi:AcrR family transcriptional regulator
MNLRLVDSSAERGSNSVVRLRPGRHGLPAELVHANQRQRTIDAAVAAHAERGYGRITVTRVTELARISTSTFYEHFTDIWSCLTEAYESEAEHIRIEVEAACAAAEGSRRDRARAGVLAALEFLASEPGVARLLSAEPPPQVDSLVAARRQLPARLGALLHEARTEDPAAPPALERRLVGAALALVSTYVVGGEADRLPELEPALSEFLLAPL